MDISSQQQNTHKSSLREHVLEAIDSYFNNIKDNGPLGLHTLGS